MAEKGGEGLYGKTDDKVITNFGFGLMIFFTVLVVVPQHRAVAAREAQVSASSRLRGRRPLQRRLSRARHRRPRVLAGAGKRAAVVGFGSTSGGGDGRGLAFYARIGRRP